jgi:hypothetical protein
MKGIKMRNFKALGLALIAVLAMCAIGVTSASADVFTSESAKANLSGANETATPDVFTITAGNTSCKEVSYTGTSSSGVSSVTVTPSYPEKTKSGEQNCTSLGFPATIHTNGCQYVFNINGGVLTTGDVQIKCTGENEITVTAVAAGTTKCVIHVPEQTLTANKVTYTTIGAGATREITVSVNVPSAENSLKYTHTKGTGLGACTAGGANNGSFVGGGTVTGTNDSGGSGHVGMFLS